MTKNHPLTQKLGLEAGMTRIGENPPSSGAYVLILRIKKNVLYHIGALGNRVLAPGLYLYAGRASRGLGKRLNRHRKRKKTVHWHIDHLTTKRQVIIEDILVIPEKPHWECRIIRTCLNSLAADVPAPGFGNSDCEEGCPSHLVRILEQN